MGSLDITQHTLAGRYAVLREIGRGGMAIVCLGHDLEQDRDVAIKILREDVASSVNTERFLREASLADALHHPAILPLLGSGTTDEGLPFFVMPFVAGENLRQRLDRERQLPVGDAIDIILQIADALATAHDQQILHRDVTPANILLAGMQAYLSDFGIARAIVSASADTLTGTGIVVGTPEFMSPEQGAGDHHIDVRADLYSLASVLYTLLAGEPPFTGPTPQAVLARKAVARAPSVRELRPTVPSGVARAIARALEPVPADRQGSVRAFVADVRTGLAQGAPMLERRRSRRLIATAVAAVAVTASGLGGAAWMHRDRANEAVRDARDGSIDIAIPALRRVAARNSRDGHVALWLAQALVIDGADSTSEWMNATDIAARDSSVTGVEAQHARALQALAHRRYEVACPAFRALTGTLSPAWVPRAMLAECLMRDSGVVADARVSSGWRFRSSWNEAKQSYLALLDDLPRGHAARRLALRDGPRVLRYEWSQYRRGKGVTDTSQRFAAFPALVHTDGGDSIVYEAHLITGAQGGAWMNPPTQRQAIERDRAVLKRIALESVATDSSSYDAQVQLARSLELAGEITMFRDGSPSALAANAAARRLATNASAHFASDFVAVRLLVKAGLFADARATVDSIRRRYPVPATRDLEKYSALLALTGQRASLFEMQRRLASATTVTMMDGRSVLVDPTLAAAATRFYLFAVLGEPRDSLQASLEQFERALRSFAPLQSRDSLRVALIGWPLSRAVPVLGSQVVRGLPPSTPVLRVQLALGRGDRAGARAMLDSLQRPHAVFPVAAISLDQLLLESSLWLALRDTTRTVQQLDDALGGMPARGTTFLNTVSEAAAIRRVMLLRASLASRANDQVTAVRWTMAARALSEPAGVLR